MEVIRYRTDLDQTRRNILIKEEQINYLPDTEPVFWDAEATATLLNDCFRLSSRAEEYVYMVALDFGCHLIGVFEISHGTISESYLSPREVFSKALLIGAAQIVIAHNHPSGDPHPSLSDFKAFRCIKTAGSQLRLPVKDFLILGKDSFINLCERRTAD